MGIFGKKKVKDYLEDEAFKKEYAELLEQRKERLRNEAKTKTNENPKSKEKSKPDDIIKPSVKTEPIVLEDKKSFKSKIPENEIILETKAPVQDKKATEIIESKDQNEKPQFDQGLDTESFELEYIKNSAEFDESFKSDLLKSIPSEDNESKSDLTEFINIKLSKETPIEESIENVNTDFDSESVFEGIESDKEKPDADIILENIDEKQEEIIEDTDIKPQESNVELSESNDVEKKGLIAKLRKSLSKTKNNILDKLNRIITANSKINEDVIDDIEEALYTSDIGVKTTQAIIENIRKSVKEQKYQNTSELKTIIQNEIIALVKTDDNLVKANFKAHPYVILVVGVNGNGKTTTIGKLAHYYKQKGMNVLIGAADTFRAAAIEQLEEWAVRSGSAFVKHKMNADPAAVAYDSYQASLARDIDVLLIDTAGRLHTKVNLMKELEKISRVLKKLNVDAPHEVLLVLDATTGQNAVSQAKQFNITTAISGLVLTKLDGTAKGGVAIAINQELNIPVKFIGVGEQIDDLQEFDPKKYVEAIFS